MRKRLLYIDRLKGFTIFFVVIIHLIIFSLLQKGNLVRDVSYVIVMPMFLFLSGVVIQSPPSFGKLLKKSVKFLMPMLTIGLAHMLYMHKTLNYFFFDSQKMGYWYLWVLTLFYILLFVFYKWNAQRKGWAGLAIDLVCTLFIYLVFMQLANRLPRDEANLFSIPNCYDYWPFFIFGYLLNKYNALEWLANNNPVFSVALIGWIPLFCYLRHSGIAESSIEFLVLDKLLQFMSIVIFLYLFRQREGCTSWVERNFEYLGMATLDIYIFHYFIVRNLCLFGLGAWFTQTCNVYLEAIFVVLAAFVIGHICAFVGKLIRQSKWVDEIVYGGFVNRIK